MAMPGRTYAAGGQKYKFGFNGKESYKDDGLDAYDYGNRIYNEKLGKFLSVDPLEGKYASFSPYHYAGNSPIYLKDNDGNDIIIHYKDADGSDLKFKYTVGINKASAPGQVRKTIEYLNSIHAVTQRMSDPDLAAYRGVNVSPEEMMNSLMESGYELHIFVFDDEDTDESENNLYKHIGSDSWASPAHMESVPGAKKSSIYYSPYISAEEYNGDKTTKTGSNPSAASILAHEMKHAYDHKIEQLTTLRSNPVPNFKNLAEKSAMMLEKLVTPTPRCDYHTPIKRVYTGRPNFNNKYKVKQSNGIYKYSGGSKKSGAKSGNFKKKFGKAMTKIKNFFRRIGQRFRNAFKRGRYNLKTKK